MKKEFLIVLLASLNISCRGTQKQTNTKPNVLFFIVDDLRPELGCYGAKQIITPNIDRLAEEGTVFLNSYANVAVCGASRASLLTGLRPIDNKRFKDWNCRSDIDAPNTITLPGYFKLNGYHTISNGKFMHVQGDSPSAWTETAWRSDQNSGAGVHLYNIYHDWVDPASDELTDINKGPFCESADVPDNAYSDGQLCDKTIADLERLANTKQSFFLACGFSRPHLPFNAPKKYWDLYDPQKLTLPGNRYRPINAPESLKGSDELVNQYSNTKGYPDEESFQRLARHGYFASVSYIDAQIGKIMQTLIRLGLKENTIIVFLGDNGFHLGEHAFWGKHNTMDHAVRTPLIIYYPKNKQQQLKQLVEFVDLYPTLCELASLPIPVHCEGKSMVPILLDASKEHKEAVFPSYGNDFSVKTIDFLYTEDNKGPKMLYNHLTDPEENINVLNNPEYKQSIEHLKSLLEDIKKTWK